MKADDYAAFLDREYLAQYVPAGGAAIKVAVVADSGAADRMEAALGAATAGRGGLYVSVSAESARVHMVDQIFFAVSRALDWQALAGALVRTAYESAAFPVPDGAGLMVAEVARHHDVDARELYRSVRRRLERRLLDDPLVTVEMARDAPAGAGTVGRR